MVATAGIRASGAYVTSLTKTSNAIRAAQAFVRVVFNFPSAGVRASNAYVTALTKTSNTIRTSNAYVTVIVRGRIANPTIRVFTFTMDGHDFYVLRLGDIATLVYDTYSKQWVEWNGSNLPFWRVHTGMNWLGGQLFSTEYGSDVVVGDDTYGLLWFLDPRLAWDESPDIESSAQQIPFDRIVTGQTLASGRQYLPCYVLFVDGDNYGLTADDFVPEIVLEYSDDQGRNFITSDTLGVETDTTVDNPYSWYSLGQIASPGRIFRITDNGVFARVDSMSMNDDAG
jgi:hypothetical protein